MYFLLRTQFDVYNVSKMSTRYPALIHKEEHSDFGVSFPDFLGCITAGETLEEAYQMAEEALQLHIEGMLAEKLEVPPPSTLDAAHYLGQENGALVVTMVRARIPTRAKRINITIDEGLLEEIDEAATGLSMNRSAFLAEGARQLMGTQQK